jgi:hypothetical protein
MFLSNFFRAVFLLKKLYFKQKIKNHKMKVALVTGITGQDGA